MTKACALNPQAIDSNTYPETLPNVCVEGPRGPVCAWFSERGLSRLHLCGLDLCTLWNAAAIGMYRRRHHQPTRNEADPRAARLAAALRRYLQGEPEDFSDVEIDLSAGTEFQQAVWEAARKVAWGRLSSYGDLARLIGRTTDTARAVGQALGANPIAIVVPCHRFVASDGSLGGFSGGLEWKRALLRLEGHF
ncbi:MAG: methylated-DNA--[protein]-cysteine S-methyltransferase [Candidatus Hydrogenedentes bacterium]|nr:methylated-DNA--[protein]-cysteine S-methyltransferase [Candidatus Hydrogenedentota bacterium]